VSIDVSRPFGEHSCNSQCERHRAGDAPAELTLGFGNLERVHLCEPCAMAAFNALGFMLMSITGKTLPQLVGLKKSKTK
jgi:hypothetical protein